MAGSSSRRSSRYLEVFEIAGFKSIFPIYGTTDQAAQQISA